MCAEARAYTPPVLHFNYSAISVQVLVLPEAPARKVPGEVREEQSEPATTPRLYTSPTRHHELDISRGIPTLASM